MNFRLELEALEKKHAEELKQVQKTEEVQTEILNNIKSYQNIFAQIESRLNTIQDSSVEVQDHLSVIKDKSGDTERVIEFANKQIAESQEKLQNELGDFEKRRESTMKYLEQELERLSKTYQEDIAAVMINFNKTINNKIISG